MESTNGAHERAHHASQRQQGGGQKCQQEAQAAVSRIVDIGLPVQRTPDQVHRPCSRHISLWLINSSNHQGRKKTNHLFKGVHLHPDSPLEMLITRHGWRPDAVFATCLPHQHAEENKLDDGQQGNDVNVIHGFSIDGLIGVDWIQRRLWIKFRFAAL